MGADMHLVFATIPLGQDPDWLAAEGYIETASLDALDPQEFYSTCEMDEVRDDLRLHLRVFRELVEGGLRRDITDGVMGGVRFWASGGMTSGDPPTQAYEAMDALLAGEVLQAAGFNREDASHSPSAEIDVRWVV